MSTTLSLYRQTGRTTRMLDSVEVAINSGLKAVVLTHSLSYEDAIRRILYNRNLPYDTFKVGTLERYMQEGHLHPKTLEWRYPERRRGEILFIDHAALENLYPGVLHHWAQFMNFEQGRVTDEPPPTSPPTQRRMRFGRRS